MEGCLGQRCRQAPLGFPLMTLGAGKEVFYVVNVANARGHRRLYHRSLPETCICSFLKRRSPPKTRLLWSPVESPPSCKEALPRCCRIASIPTANSISRRAYSAEYSTILAFLSLFPKSPLLKIDQLIVLHISSRTVELQIPLDNLVHRGQKVLLGCHLPPRPDGKHPRLSSHTPQLRPRTEFGHNREINSHLISLSTLILFA